MIRGIFAGRRITIKFPQRGSRKQEVGSSVHNITDTWSNFKYKETQKSISKQVQWVIWDNLGRELPPDGLYEITRIKKILPSWYQGKILNLNVYTDGNILENTPENRKATNYKMGMQETQVQKILEPTAYDGVNNLNYLEESDGIDIDFDTIAELPESLKKIND